MLLFIGNHSLGMLVSKCCFRNLAILFMKGFRDVESFILRAFGREILCMSFKLVLGYKKT